MKKPTSEKVEGFIRVEIEFRKDALFLLFQPSDLFTVGPIYL